MIAKCVAVFALVAQISASTVLLPTCESAQQHSPLVLFSPGNSASSCSASPAVSRNIFAKGRYPVALRNCGPSCSAQIPVTTSRVIAPVQEKPTVRLPASIPAPRTIAHSCTCYKTIVRPHVHDQVITVPTVQRYVETGHNPVIENIQYEAVPVNCNNCGFSSGVKFLNVGSGASSGCVKLLPVGSGCSCGCQSIRFPQVEIPRIEVVQAVQVPEIETVQIPQTFGCTSQC